MYEVYASVRKPEYRLVKPKPAPLPSWAHPHAWQLLTECDHIGELPRRHCDKYGFYVSGTLFPLELPPLGR